MSARQVAFLAAGLIALHLAVRSWLAWTGGFYWDDLILIGRSGQWPLLSRELLLYDHDGHFMPGAFALAWFATHFAPLNWAVPALTLVLGQALAAAAVLRVLYLMLGMQPILVPPLAFYLFVPLTLPSFAWWSAGLNSLPLQIGLAWVTGDAIMLCRTGCRRYAVTGTLVAALALACFEKAVLVAPVACALVALLYRVDGDARPLRTAVARGRALWLPLAAVTALWAVAYCSVTETRPSVPSFAEAAELAHRATSLGVAPALVGGPLVWERWPPAPPWATPPVALIVLGWIVAAAAVVWSLRARRRTGAVWLLLLGYLALSEASMIVVRTGPDTAAELAQTLRYVADSAVVLTLGWAVIARAPRREPPRRAASHRLRAAAAAGVAAFVVCSLVSTATFAQRWREDPTPAYLATARASLAAHRDAPILDHPVAVHILLPVAHPHNLASHVFGPLADRPEFARHTEVLRVLDDSGRLVRAEVTGTRWLGQGPVPGCGHRVGNTPARLPLGEPLMDWEWAVRLNYYAATDGEVELGLDGSADTVVVPVRAGLHTVFVRLLGAGEAVRLRVRTPGLALCVGDGQVGVVVPTDLPQA
ncbi:MAG TPA: hypothetical protein VK083_12290 [Nocardia sp.]|uniref:hypothetical protein n=1 Tax=Nocardia sp. TaxID=1821 RepID=UPI002B4B5130|nr:hypothetical protein [Nocardia sp.]HLS77560.1 hypothetical protein [Nocardia sp.]